MNDPGERERERERERDSNTVGLLQLAMCNLSASFALRAYLTYSAGCEQFLEHRGTRVVVDDVLRHEEIRPRHKACVRVRVWCARARACVAHVVVG